VACSQKSPLQVVAAALINDVGEVLLCQKASGPFAGLWELPGGKVEPGESQVEALKRELAEELLADVQLDPEPFGVAFGDVAGRAIEMFGYKGRVVGGELTLTEHKELRWIKPSQVEQLQLGPLDQDLFKKLVAATPFFIKQQ
jgi:8-oxo-dGTP diphosphatase